MQANPLDDLRGQVQQIDEEILELLANRGRLISQIKTTKKVERQSIHQPDVFHSKEKLLIQFGTNIGLSESFIKDIWHTIHAESMKKQGIFD